MQGGGIVWRRVARWIDDQRVVRVCLTVCLDELVRSEDLDADRLEGGRGGPACGRVELHEHIPDVQELSLVLSLRRGAAHSLCR